ncbi:CbtB domain-containing protein [Lacibacterium aquatile]|uniref:CbtB domain-containing protein n=1 Tax=Lacibacterium aquatile TaxID=1168082 RepID=A0ABW5DWY9_9PROT
MPISSNVSTAGKSAAVSRSSSTTFQALLAMAFGLLIVGMAGFSHSEILHNAGHDTRHSNAFPCH